MVRTIAILSEVVAKLEVAKISVDDTSDAVTIGSRYGAISVTSNKTFRELTTNTQKKLPFTALSDPISVKVLQIIAGCNNAI